MTEEASFAQGLVGVVLDGRYRLDALLGEGGMGAVYRAHHLAMDRKVAVKLLKPHLTQETTALQRFAREARSTMKVDSPHAVKVLDYGVTPHQDYYMVLEYLDGRTVQRELDVDGPFAPLRVLHIAKQALLALGAAHRSGLIHRDIKPDNLLLMRVGDDPDYTKVLDFGVAKLMEGAASDKSMLALTAAGMVFGTPEFMSPEQACGQPLDGRSDLYALAATMFAMLTGCGLFQAGSPIEWLTSHARTPPPHLVEGKPELAPYPQLDELIQRCLAKRAEHRPKDADAMIDMIEAVERALGATPSPISRPATPAPRPKPLVSTFSPSSYIPALTSDLREPTTTAAPTRADASIVGTGTDSLASLPSSRRGLYIVLGALAIVAMIVVAIVIASGKGKKDVVAGKPVDASVAVAGDAAIDAVVAAAPVDAAIDAPAMAKPIDAGHSSGSHPQIPHTNPEVERHIAAAYAAQRQGKYVTQIQEAQAVLDLDPHNVKAKLLIADAQIASGAVELGCKLLRELGRNPVAMARAKSAKCPAN